MAFQANISVRDGISPALAMLIRKVRDKKPILEAMGAQLVSLTVLAFTDESLRPAPWLPRKARKGDDGHSLLRKSGAMWHSIRISELTNDHVTVASDRPYASYQQFGTKHIPARPFFPFKKNGRLTQTAQEKILHAAGQKMISLARESTGK